MLKLPVEAGQLLGEDEGAGSGVKVGAGWEGGVGRDGVRPGLRGGASKAKLEDGDSSGSEDWEKVGAARSIAGRSVKSKGVKGKGGGSKGTDKAAGKLQDRLSAVMELRRRNSGEGSGLGAGAGPALTTRGDNRSKKTSSGIAVQQGVAGRKGAGRLRHERERDITDLDYLGGGMFQAGREARALYEACRADIEAHAKGARCSMDDGLEVLEVQVRI
jgi:hypothetical protein